MSSSLRILPVALLSLFLSACAATEPPVVEAPPPPPPVAVSPLDSYTALVLEDNGLRVRRSASEEVRMEAEGDVGFISVSPDGHVVVVGIGGQLIAVPQEGMINVLSSGPAERVYSGAWSEDGSRFHFGHYVAAGNTMGAGGIETWDRPADEVRSVGCSASKVVLSALPDGSLLVRNTDNIFQVAADGCRTLRTVDARKLHHVTPSPDGTYLAYILRDLVYNRDRRAYEPDSTLYIESTAGSEPVKIIGDKYSPRNLSWSLNGADLIYDVAPPSADAMRSVSVYAVADGRSSYLLPPSSSQAMTHGKLSPNGRHALIQVTADGQSDWQVKLAGAQFAQSVPIPESGMTSIGWITDELLLVRSEDGSAHLVSLIGGSPRMTDLEHDVIWVWPKS
jgi:hypothetical protein